MRTRATLAAVVATSLACASRDVAGPSLPAPDAAPPAAAFVAGADSVVVEVEAQGCFHHDLHRLTFVPDGDGARVALVSGSPSPLFAVPGRAARLDAPPRVEGVTLARLERMLAAYRAIPQDAGIVCTSTIEFRVARWSGGAVVHEERIFDGTCAGFGRETTAVLWDELLVRRARDE